MLKVFYFFLMLPFGCLAQITISGNIISQADKKPVVNASVFLSNATIGTKAGADGSFSLPGVQPGIYQLVVSIVGFENYTQNITVARVDVELPVIALSPKTITLKEVNIKYRRDPDREKYLGWFKDEFLGTSRHATDCKILNPELIDLTYDDVNHKLTASSADYLTIENNALGYRLKYLVTDFSLEKQNENEKKIFYKGPVHFEELPGTETQKNRWLKNRREVYENSPMHFLRSALNNTITEEGFRVQKVINTSNTETITAKTKDFIKMTDVPGMYALVDGGGMMYVAYSKSHRYYIKNSTEYLYNNNNDENTLILFNSPAAFFYGNGVVVNPYSVTYYGVWGRNRVAELLPTDYWPDQSTSEENVIADKITAKLDTFISTHPKEKAYLQLDKPCYAAGDTIYFKAYVTDGWRHFLSTLSGVLHVDIINPKNKVDQSIKLRLDSGIAWGDFALPDSLPKGNYRVRAYTTLMRSDDTLICFNKTIPIGSLQEPVVSESIVRQSTRQSNLPDIQFFPEGGKLVIGVNSKVAFKAIGQDGLGIPSTGVIEESGGREVATFKSAHLGMGYFYLKPEPGKTYVAKISYADGEQDVATLPTAENTVTLAIGNSDSQEIPLTLSTAKDYFERNRNHDYIVHVFSGGLSTTLNVKLDKALVNLKIDKSKLHTGVASVTLFSNSYEPLCERLVFINNNDQLNLTISNEKNSYVTREKVKIDLQVFDKKSKPIEGHFSAAVVNESLVPENKTYNENILTYLLLTSDIKGNVEQPAYYFSDTTATAKNNLDILMLTQGYRMFEWKKMLNEDNNPAVAFKPEQGLEISGIVKSLWGKPIANGNVSLINPGGGVLSSQTDEKGVFHFSKLLFTDTASFILSAVNAANKNSTKLTLLPSIIGPISTSTNIPAERSFPDTAMSRYLTNLKNERKEYPHYDDIKGTLLREVKIKERKRDDNYVTQSLAGAGHADQVLHSKDLFGGQLSTSLNLLRGITLARNGVATVPYLTSELAMAGMHAPIPMLVVVDGAELLSTPDHPIDVNMISTSDVETIEVLKFANTSIYGMSGAGGVLIITTKQAIGATNNIPATGILPIKVMGFYKARKFYSPKYENVAQTAKQEDFRSTVYWQPELTTDKNGHASFYYYNADVPGSYKIVIEGIDQNGNLGRQVFRYTVK